MPHLETRSLDVHGIETRADVTDDEANEDLTTAVAAVAELRAVVDERITASTGELTALQERMDTLEAQAQRPGASVRKDEPNIEHRAFSNYLRHGREAMQPDEVRTLKLGDDTAGGYLATPEFNTEMVRLLTEVSPIRTIASVRTTSAASVIYPKRTSLTAAAWTSEVASASASEPAFGQLEIPVHGARTYTDISQTLLEDAAVNPANEVAQALTEDFAKLEGTAFVNGTGTGQPQGFMTDTDVASTDNGHATILQVDGILDLFHALPSFYRNRSVWVMNSTTLGAVRKLKDATNVYLWAPSLQAADPGVLLGRPIVEVPDMPNVGDGTYPMVLADWDNFYRIIDRISLSVLRDPYTQATQSLVRFHARRRVGGAVRLAEAGRKLLMST